MRRTGSFSTLGVSGLDFLDSAPGGLVDGGGMVAQYVIVSYRSGTTRFIFWVTDQSVQRYCARRRP
jgi:hypothetical protein